MRMAKIIQRVELTLRSFYIFNSTLGRKEGEESKKILFYHPEDIEMNTKINDVGLSEAIIAFTGTFDSSDKCKALHTQKTTQVYYQPEKNYWMVLVINAPKEIRSKDGVEIIDYKGSEVHDYVYRATLQQCYNMFRLFAGTFEMNLNDEQEYGNNQAYSMLVQKLQLFYNKYLLTLKLTTCDVIDAARSLQYLPLDKSLFLRVHNFVNIIQSTFSTIAEAIFLYNEHVVCSKICASDLYSLHEYLKSTIFPKTIESELAGGSLSRINSTSSDFYRSGAFVTGPGDNENCSKPTKVYIMHENKLQCFYLIIYKVINATLCLLVTADRLPSNDFYLELHSFMGPQLASIASDIGESLVKSGSNQNIKSSLPNISPCGTETSGLMTPKFLFINEQNMKYISNMYFDKRRPKTNSIPANVMNLIADLNSNSDSSITEEVQVKTTNDFWIVKKSCNWRQFYVIIFNSAATLLDVTSEARRVFEQELTDDVFFDK